MLRFRNYWIYSAGLAIAWAVVLILALTIRGSESAQTILLVFDHPVGLFRLLYRLGVNDDCPIRLSAAKALGVEPLKGVISSIDPPCGPRASDTQLTVVCRNNFPHSDEKIWAETCRFHLTCSAPQ